MLAINWEDVVRMIESLRPQLIGIGVILLLAIILTFAVIKTSTPVRKLVIRWKEVTAGAE